MAGGVAGRRVILSLCQGRPAQWLTLLLSEGLFILLFWSAGLAATHMASAESPLARTSIGSGLWLWLALCLLACSDAIRRLISSAVWRWVLNAQIWCIPLFLLFSGELNNLAVKRVRQPPRYLMMPRATPDDPLRHAPSGASARDFAGHVVLPPSFPPGQHFAVLNVIQTIPSVALFGLLIAPLAGLVKSFPVLGAAGIAGTGLTPALIALVLYALLPLVRGVVAGLSRSRRMCWKAPMPWG